MSSPSPVDLSSHFAWYREQYHANYPKCARLPYVASPSAARRLRRRVFESREEYVEHIRKDRTSTRRHRTPNRSLDLNVLRQIEHGELVWSLAHCVAPTIYHPSRSSAKRKHAPEVVTGFAEGHYDDKSRLPALKRRLWEKGPEMKPRTIRKWYLNLVPDTLWRAQWRPSFVTKLSGCAMRKMEARRSVPHLLQESGFKAPLAASLARQFLSATVARKRQLIRAKRPPKSKKTEANDAHAMEGVAATQSHQVSSATGESLSLAPHPSSDRMETDAIGFASNTKPVSIAPVPLANPAPSSIPGNYMPSISLPISDVDGPYVPPVVDLVAIPEYAMEDMAGVFQGPGTSTYDVPVAPSQGFGLIHSDADMTTRVDSKSQDGERTPELEEDCSSVGPGEEARCTSDELPDYEDDDSGADVAVVANGPASSLLHEKAEVHAAVEAYLQEVALDFGLSFLDEVSRSMPDTEEDLKLIPAHSNKAEKRVQEVLLVANGGWAGEQGERESDDDSKGEENDCTHEDAEVEGEEEREGEEEEEEEEAEGEPKFEVDEENCEMADREADHNTPEGIYREDEDCDPRREDEKMKMRSKKDQLKEAQKRAAESKHLRKLQKERMELELKLATLQQRQEKPTNFKFVLNNQKMTLLPRRSEDADENALVNAFQQVFQ
ncbi:uncharacterized protein FIBRA_01694 [Fibroporia radiculosa]|uniref:Uncharacterized protein n=1 Tax=Fibroporia radiculosa TaxID=599839 RepID=J4G147_9APHY|nr:uncharacterized protein FIBRA_01694 [Fibroporia radiculosa]CCL99673.1 predicted protein [Fibroporia radiculosa]